MLSSCHGLKRPHSVKLLFPSPHKCGKVHRSDGRVSRAPEIQSALDTIFLGAEMKSLLPEPFRCVQADGGGRAAARVGEWPPHQLFGRSRHRREVFSGEGKVASENIVGRLVVRVVKEGRNRRRMAGEKRKEYQKPIDELWDRWKILVAQPKSRSNKKVS